MNPFVLGGSMLLNTGLEYLKNRNRPKMVSPEEAYKSMVLSAGDINSIRQPLYSQIGSQNMATQQSIRQAGAANRMPAGSVLSSLAGSTYGAGRAMGSIEPQLAEMKRRSVLDWLNYRNQYNAGEGAARQDEFAGYGAALGAATKLAALYDAGFFDEDKNDNGLYKYNFKSIGQPSMKRANSDWEA